MQRKWLARVEEASKTELTAAWCGWWGSSIILVFSRLPSAALLRSRWSLHCTEMDANRHWRELPARWPHARACVDDCTHATNAPAAR